jgi:hypothetical protein
VSEVDFAEEARRVEEEADSYQEVVDELRGSMEYQKALLEQGWHKENTGISVCNLSYWKEQRKEAVDTHHFDYLLREIMEAELVFWKHYYEFDLDQDFVNAVVNGDLNTASDSAENIVKTWKWLTEEIEAPEELETRQEGLNSFVGGGGS